MNLQQMEYIIAVEQHRHFAKAAAACFVTQPTLSMMIQKLEDELGIKVFDRSRQPVVPTPAGEIVIGQARVILQEVHIMKDLLRQQKQNLTGELRVGVIPTLAPYLIPRFVNSFLEKYPEVNLSISERITDQVVRDLKNNDLDVGILVGPLNDPSIRETPLFYEPLLVYSSHGFDKTSLLPEEGHCLRSQIMNLCELRHRWVSRLSYETGSLETLVRLVASGNGVTILPALAAEILPEEQKERVFPFLAPAPVREVSLAIHRNFLKRDLIEALGAEVRAGVPEEYHFRGETVPVSLHS